jgi:hypothetical protein
MGGGGAGITRLIVDPATARLLAGEFLENGSDAAPTMSEVTEATGWTGHQGDRP